MPNTCINQTHRYSNPMIQILAKCHVKCDSKITMNDNRFKTKSNFFSVTAFQNLLNAEVIKLSIGSCNGFICWPMARAITWNNVDSSSTSRLVFTTEKFHRLRSRYHSLKRVCKILIWKKNAIYVPQGQMIWYDGNSKLSLFPFRTICSFLLRPVIL